MYHILQLSNTSINAINKFIEMSQRNLTYLCGILITSTDIHHNVRIFSFISMVCSILRIFFRVLENIDVNKNIDTKCVIFFIKYAQSYHCLFCLVLQRPVPFPKILKKKSDRDKLNWLINSFMMEVPII